MLRIPARIHVDANMHPEIYRNLLHFAVLFDQTSLYCVAGKLYEEHGPVDWREFKKLINCQTKPFQLTASDNWYNFSSRKKLNETVVGWHHEFDDWVITNYGVNNVVTPPKNSTLQKKSWDVTHAFHEAADLWIRERGIRSFDELEGITSDDLEDEIFLQGLKSAQSLWRTDRKSFDAMKQTLENQDIKKNDVERLLELKFSGQLPLTLYNSMTRKGYGELLGENNPLAILVFEHVTKPAIVQAINKDSRIDQSFSLFIPGKWHQLLMQGFSIHSTNSLIDWSYLASDQEGIVGRFFDHIEWEEDKVGIVDDIIAFRKIGGPQIIRKIIEKKVNDYLDLRKLGRSKVNAVESAFELAAKTVLDYANRSNLSLRLQQQVFKALVVAGGALMGVPAVGARPTIEVVQSFMTDDSFIARWADKMGGRKAYLSALYGEWVRSAQPKNVLPTPE